MEYKDPVVYINQTIYQNIIKDKRNDNRNLFECALIKKHLENLTITGDISFPVNGHQWHQCTKIPCFKHPSKISDCRNILICLSEVNKSDNNDDENKLNHILEDLVKKSKMWIFPLEKVTFSNDRCLLFLDRFIVFDKILKFSLEEDNFGCFPKNENKNIFLKTSSNDDPNASLNVYRGNLTQKVIYNLLQLSEWNVITERTAPTDEQNNCIILLIENFQKSQTTEEENFQKSQTTEEENFGKIVKIKCGLVLDASTNKLTTLSYEDYFRKRSKDMQLIAMHKYGLRIYNEEKFRKFVEKMGRAAVTVDILEVKHSSPVSIKGQGQGCTKGASFILYNSARIETLLRTFSERVQDGNYPELPSLAEVDFTLLKEEEEWQLMYNYILAFPNLINRTLCGLENGRCYPHYIVQFLTGLAALFSVYYRRVRILTENRTHLLTVLYARIYLVKSIRKVLNLCLNFLDLQPVQYM